MRFFTICFAVAAAAVPAFAAPISAQPQAVNITQLQQGSGASWLGDLGTAFLDAFQRRELEMAIARSSDVQAGSGASWLSDLGTAFLDAFQRRDDEMMELIARTYSVQDGSGASWFGDLGTAFLDAFQRRELEARSKPVFVNGYPILS